uniref:Secreted protein n=1 Tax=Ascaris lumbricoides TaxID=6252 RepID=A0A0M3IPC5_ASCLU
MSYNLLSFRFLSIQASAKKSFINAVGEALFCAFFSRGFETGFFLAGAMSSSSESAPLSKKSSTVTCGESGFVCFLTGLIALESVSSIDRLFGGTTSSSSFTSPRLSTIFLFFGAGITSWTSSSSSSSSLISSTE